MPPNKPLGMLPFLLGFQLVAIAVPVYAALTMVTGRPVSAQIWRAVLSDISILDLQL